MKKASLFAMLFAITFSPWTQAQTLGDLLNRAERTLQPKSNEEKPGKEGSSPNLQNDSDQYLKAAYFKNIEEFNAFFTRLTLGQTINSDPLSASLMPMVGSLGGDIRPPDGQKGSTCRQKFREFGSPVMVAFLRTKKSEVTQIAPDFSANASSEHLRAFNNSLISLKNQLNQIHGDGSACQRNANLLDGALRQLDVAANAINESQRLNLKRTHLVQKEKEEQLRKTAEIEADQKAKEEAEIAAKKEAQAQKDAEAQRLRTEEQQRIDREKRARRIAG